MRLLSEIRERVRALFSRAREDRELDEELAFHLEMAIEENLRRGLSPEEARRQAHIRLGGLTQVREATRDARGLRGLDDLVADLRYALRGMRRSPAFALAAVLTLALGIGANSALFGLLNALTNRMPAGVPASDRLVRVANPGPLEDASYPDFVALRGQLAPVLRLAASFDTHVALGSGGEPERVRAQLVSADYFTVLGVVPVLGRGFLAEEDRPPAMEPVVVLGHGLWLRRFGGDPGVVGRGVVVNGEPFTVIGIAPPGFVGESFEHPAELWAPIATQPVTAPTDHDLLDDRRYPRFRLVGRLERGISLAEAEAAVAVVAERLDPLEPERFRPLSLEVQPLRGWLGERGFGSMRPLIAFAWALTGLVLLVACANVANLLLARAVARRAELGVRLAIGAGRGRLIRQLLTESTLLSLAAGAVGTLVAFAGARWFEARFRGPFAPLDVAPDARTLVFTLLLSLATGVLFGLAPAWRASRPDVRPLLGGGGDGAFRRGRLQGALVVAQVALSTVLLFTAGLFVRRLQAAGSVDLGYDAARVATLSFDLHALRYDDGARAASEAALRDRLRRLPGVEAVAVPAYVPFDGQGVLVSVRAAASDPSRGPGRVPRARDGAGTVAIGIGVAPDYFRALGISLLRGRDYEPGDHEPDRATVIVSESLARRLWPGEDPIGRALSIGGTTGAPVLEVVGVVGDIAATGIPEEYPAIVYLPHTRPIATFTRTSVVVRTAVDPSTLLPAVRREIRALDPVLPVFDARPLADLVDREIGVQRRLTGIVSGFGAIALALAALGLYGVVAYTVAGRTRDIGVRMALGARDRDVVRTFVLERLRLTAVGLVIGGVLAAALGRVVAGIVFGVRPLDPATALAVATTLMAAAWLASFAPARRAARVDPVAALRAE